MAWWDDPAWAPQLPTAMPEGAKAGHWVMPNWSQLLGSDPGAIAARATLEGGTTQAGLGRQNAIRQALIKWGIVPKDYGTAVDPSVMSGIADPATLAAAAQNPNSYLAQLNAQRARASADLAAELGARGGLLPGGGALTGGEQMATNAYDTGLSTGTQALLGEIGGAESTYGTTIGGLQTDWNKALGEAAGRVQGGYGPTWQEDPAAAAYIDPTVNEFGVQTAPYSTTVGGDVAAAVVKPAPGTYDPLAPSRPTPGRVKPPPTFVPTRRGQRRYRAPRLPAGMV